MTVQSTRSYSNPQVQKAWREYVEALQEAQGRRTAEVRRAEDQFRSQAQRYGLISSDAGNPGGQTPVTTTQAVTGQGGADQAALDKMFKEAEKWVGFNERGTDGNPFSTFFGRGPEAWCADFVSYLHEIAGMPLGKKGVGFPGCTEMANWFKQQNAFHNGTPKPGDTIFFNWNGDSDQEDHVGIVLKVENGRVYTIEGNSSDGVRRRDYPLNDKVISGYGSRLRLGNLGQGENPLDPGSADMSGSTQSTPGGGGGGSGSSATGGSGFASPTGGSSGGGGGGNPAVNPGGGGGHTNPTNPTNPGNPTNPSDPGQTSTDFFAKLIGALMEMNDEQRRVLAKSLGKNSEFAKYGQQRMGANFDPANPPLWLALEFIEDKLGKLAETPEGEAVLAQLSQLDGEALVNAVATLMERLDSGDPNALTQPLTEGGQQTPPPTVEAALTTTAPQTAVSAVQALATPDTSVQPGLSQLPVTPEEPRTGGVAGVQNTVPVPQTSAA